MTRHWAHRPEFAVHHGKRAAADLRPENKEARASAGLQKRLVPMNGIELLTFALRMRDE